MRIFGTVFFLGALVFTFGIAATPFASAQQKCPLPPSPNECGPPPPGTFECTRNPYQRTTVYRCGNNTCGYDGGFVEQGQKFYTCRWAVDFRLSSVTVPEGGGCPSYSYQCGKKESRTADPPKIDESTKREFSKAGKYQTCPVPPAASPEQWLPAPPAYQCSGACYPAPEVKPLKDAGLFPKNVFESRQRDGSMADPSKVKLPVVVGWENNAKKEVESAGNQNPDPRACQVLSYEYEFLDGTASLQKQKRNLSWFNDLEKMQTDPRLDEYQCTLPNDSAPLFRARACQFEDGGDCGKWSNDFAFTTSSAPELKTPYDPDWEEEKSALTRIPASINWCPLPNAKAFYYQVFEKSVSDKTLVLDDMPFAPVSRYEDSDGEAFQKDIQYVWRVASCSKQGLSACRIFSQLWSFIPGEYTASAPVLSRPLFTPAAPNIIPSINLSDNLEWTGTPFASFYLLDIGNGGTQRFMRNKGSPTSFSAGQFLRSLQLNTIYTWSVAACSQPDEFVCEATSEEWKFKTTGAPPSGLQTKPVEDQRTAIPFALVWDDVPGAASYKWEMATETTFTSIVAEGIAKGETNALVQYENVVRGIPKFLDQDTKYFWRVKTCADEGADVCGGWSISDFTTVKLSAPSITSPKPDGVELIPRAKVFWDKGFSENVYYAKVVLHTPSPNETSPSCRNVLPQEDTTVENSISFDVRCIGTYELQLQSCIDTACTTEAKSPVASRTFLVKEPPGEGGGLVPCGRSNNPDTTDWDDRDPCGIKHVFLLIRNIIDFALWKLSLIIVVLMAIATGAIIFFSFGGVDVLTKIRSIWKAVGIGVLILLFSWLFLNILLGLVGFNITFYGKWYDIQF